MGVWGNYLTVQAKVKSQFGDKSQWYLMLLGWFVQFLRGNSPLRLGDLRRSSGWECMIVWNVYHVEHVWTNVGKTMSWTIPQITMFIGGMFTIPKWVVYYCFTHPHCCVDSVRGKQAVSRWPSSNLWSHWQKARDWTPAKLLCLLQLQLGLGKQILSGKKRM